ncbi:MAG TPA: diguanylate cyclase [Gemmatimonadaceae bacterium]
MLLWQGRVRVAVAVVVGGMSTVLQLTGVLHGDPTALLTIVAAYIALVGILGFGNRRTNVAGNAVVVTTVIADLLFIFLSTIVASPVAHYDRILILSFFVLHLTESYFGGKHAVLAFLAIIGGYAVVLAGANANGVVLNMADELWSVGVFAIAGVAFLIQYGSFQHRLETIVELFEGAEEGDFSNSYDIAADKKPDAVTRVGRAYNRVRSQLASMVLTDPLTSCLNRRGLDQALAREIARSSRAGSELSLLAIDLDHFKQINDSYGHLGGDYVLREFGALLAQTARAGDIVARTGGEEFTILLPDTEPSGAYRAGVRLCDTVRMHPFVLNDKRVHITISVGVMSTAGRVLDAEASKLKERADEALYAAKRGGRDRVRVWNEELASLEADVSAGDAILPHASQVVAPTTK